MYPPGDWPFLGPKPGGSSGNEIFSTWLSQVGPKKFRCGVPRFFWRGAKKRVKNAQKWPVSVRFGFSSQKIAEQMHPSWICPPPLFSGGSRVQPGSWVGTPPASTFFQPTAGPPPGGSLKKYLLCEHLKLIWKKS